MGLKTLFTFVCVPSLVSGFVVGPLRERTTRRTELDATLSRRSWATATTCAIGTALQLNQPALAITMVTTEEFFTILKDSARSIRVVEFSGPKSETVTVRLVDGTAFGIKDVIESPTDPRSPLRVSAACRENQVPTKFLDIEALLATAPKKKKVYSNERVLEANEKEKERQARIAQDEEARLAELYRLEEAQSQ